MFCRKCGILIPDDSVFCTRCGTPVQGGSSSGGEGSAAPPREYAEVFREVVAKDKYDLYIGDTRLVMLKLQSSGSYGSLLGPVGTIVEAGVSRAKGKKYDDDLTLDQKIRRDKSNFSIDYSSIASVRLGKGKLGGMIFQVRYRDQMGSERKLDISVKGEQFDKLAVTIPSIPLLAAKFQQKGQDKQ
jgi:hypothetical protein